MLERLFLLLFGIWIGMGMPLPDCIFGYCTEESAYEEAWDKGKSCEQFESQ